jgi:hypothetical protein
VIFSPESSGKSPCFSAWTTHPILSHTLPLLSPILFVVILSEPHGVGRRHGPQCHRHDGDIRRLTLFQASSHAQFVGIPSIPGWKTILQLRASRLHAWRVWLAFSLARICIHSFGNSSVNCCYFLRAKYELFKIWLGVSVK